MSNNISPDLIRGADGLLRPPWAATDPLLRNYYDTEWGMPVHDEQGLFDRLCLESFQAGLSWAIILRKREAFRRAFADFSPAAVAQITDISPLLADASIIRNRRKIAATINNAQATIALRATTPLPELIWSFQPAQTPAPRHLSEIPRTTPESVALAKALKRAGFTFVGPTTVFALMQAIGMVDTHLVGSHRRGTSGIWN